MGISSLVIFINKLVLANKVVILTNKRIFEQALTLPPLVKPLQERLPEVPCDLSNGQPWTRVKDRRLELCPPSRGGKKDEREGAQEEKSQDYWKLAQ